jgi:hypothetical protein
VTGSPAQHARDDRADTDTDTDTDSGLGRERIAPVWPAFVGYRPPPSGRDTASSAKVAVTAEAGDVLRYRWPAMPGESVIYRVVTDDEAKPFSPDYAEPVETTMLTEATDQRPIRTACRYVQVWAHVGADREAAAATQPKLAAAATVVAPVRDCRVRAVGDQVSGSWETADGVEQVMILRLPADRARQLSSSEFDRQYQISQHEDARHGFVDESCPPGSYEYRIFAAVRLDTLTLSPPRLARVEVVAPLLPVLDLRATALPDDDAIRLDWTSPSDRVAIYLTQEAPRPGIEDEPVERDRLETAGLGEDARLVQPVQSLDMRRTIPRVPLPHTDGILYLTPVTYVGDRARVGPSIAHSRAGLIKNVRLTERVNLQLVTFSWPGGADQVQLHQTRKGVPLPDPPGPALDTLDVKGYRARGGMRIRARLLPSKGCDLHLVPLTWYQGVARRGTAAVVRYEGLLRIYYRLLGDGPARQALLRSGRRRVLEVQSDQAVASRLPFVVVHNPDRLPLSPSDGHVIVRESSPLEAGVWTRLKDFRLPRRQRGWLRVFVDEDLPVVAVLDPPVDTLEL